MNVVRESNSARGIALLALVVVLVAGIVNAAATAIQSQDNCQDIQRVNARLSHILKKSREDLVSGKRDFDLQSAYGSDPRKLPDGQVVPHWQYVKIQSIQQYNDLIPQFKEDKCPLPILGLHHRK